MYALIQELENLGFAETLEVTLGEISILKVWSFDEKVIHVTHENGIYRAFVSNEYRGSTIHCDTCAEWLCGLFIDSTSEI